jgi:helicase
MAFHGLFIGISKYAEPDVQELVGAARDATALHALFHDTISGSSPILLTNEQATVQKVREALEKLEKEAGSDDTVVLYFSGHGSHDHRLATHDVSLANLGATTISMQDIADFFKRTAANRVLFILDCCFSGGAPAKVLEDSPIPKSGMAPFEELAGEGRVLLTACDVNEVAYESPITRHGLLTKALLDSFLNSSGPVDILSTMDKVLGSVRAEAARMGIVQTPVLLGTVRGGLVLPRFVVGATFSRAFPEYVSIKIGSAIDDLKKLGYPEVVVQAWADKYPAGLNELQLTAVNDYGIAVGKSVVVVAPTSSGKTFVGELAAAKAITDGRKSVFLFPYKALVNEKYDQFQVLYGEVLGMRVIRCSGDYADEASAFVRGKYDLAVLTYEMFLQLVVTFPTIRNQLGLVVVDEAQFITDPGRGISVELLLTHLLSGRERGISCQLIALSAVIGNANSFHDWLDCALLASDKRPVPLIEGVIDRSGVFEFLDIDGTRKQEQLVPAHEIVMRKSKASAQDVIVPLVHRLLNDGEQVIVFRNQRGSAQGCAAYLSRDLGLPSAQAVIDLLPASDNSSSSAALRQCLQGGTAFHTTNLTREERVVVERAFRDPANNIRALAATTTVAAGINTPASTVILAEQEFVGEDGRPFTVAEYKNMAGRAGRLGFREKGKSIIYAENYSDRDKLFRKYVLGKLEQLHSSFDPKHLDTWTLRLLAQVPSVPRAEVVRLLANTYAGHLENRRDPSWRGRMTAQVENLIARMITAELLEVEGEFVRLTLLGRACGRSALSFRSALRLIELLRSVPKTSINAKNIMLLIQVLEEADAYTPMMPGNKEAARVNQAFQRYDPSLVPKLQKFAEKTEEYWARCKRVSVLFDWVNGVKMETIESQFSTSPFRGTIEHGDVRRFADTTRFVLRSAGELLSLVVSDVDIAESLDVLLNQLEVGLPEQALDLLDLPMPLNRGQYLDLYERGINNPTEFWKADPALLGYVFSKRELADIEKKRPL